MSSTHDPYHSLARDETNLTTELQLIVCGESVDLKQSVRRAAFMAARLGQINIYTLRALLRAALTVSPHPMAGHFLERLNRLGRVVWHEEHWDGDEDEVEFAVRRRAEWIEDNEAEALGRDELKPKPPPWRRNRNEHDAVIEESIEWK